VVSRRSAPADIRAAHALSLHPSKPLLALIDRTADKLLVLRFDGTVVFECSAPPRHPGSPDWTGAGYHHYFHFDATGAYLWCVAGVAKGKIEVQLRETDGWNVVSREIVRDALDQGSSASVHPAGRADTVALCLARDGDGFCVYYWVVRDGDRFRCVLEPALDCTLPPVFAPSGREFLAADVPSPGAPLLMRHHASSLANLDQEGTRGALQDYDGSDRRRAHRLLAGNGR
jgi:hypothetical protein